MHHGNCIRTLFCFSQEKSLQSHLRGCVATAKRVVDFGGEEIEVIDVDGDDEEDEGGGTVVVGNGPLVL